MLRTRALRADDFKEVKEIHEKYYQSEFALPDFLNDFIGAFVIETEQGIVSVCSIRRIAEIITLTNKDYSPKMRVAALLRAAEILTHIGFKYGYDQLHAFVQDETWEQQLLRVGFHHTRGKSLVLDI